MKEITITKEAFMEVVAETMASEDMTGIVKTSPMLVLAFVMFGGELTRALFGKEEEGNENE